MNVRPVLFLLLILAASGCAQSRAAKRTTILHEDAKAHTWHFDVVVVSGSSGGFGAALAAGRMGARVALVEPAPVLGGMLSNGVSNIDAFSMESLSGIFDEFRLRVKAFYAKDDPDDPIFTKKEGQAQNIDGRSQQSNPPSEGGRWEPHVADRLLKEMIAKTPNVEVFYDETPTGVVMHGNRILGIVAENKEGMPVEFLGTVVIDATPEGDIAAWAGVPYSIGREARSPLEPHAGRIFFFDQTGEILPGSTGAQDRAIPSSGYRLTLKRYPPDAARSPLLAAPPPGYRQEDYVSAAYSFHPSMPHGKAELNANPFGNEIPGENWDWPELSPKQREHLAEIYKDHALGYLYYLQHVKGQTHLGLAQDEYTENGNIPYQMYLREGRRIHGEFTMTEADINPFILGSGLRVPFHQDSIAIGHYPMDMKPVRQKTDQTTPDKGDGDAFLSNVSQPFQIPYGAIVPQKVDGLLVPVAMSATHVAFSAIRMDPTWMSLGQAAGTAAALSIHSHREVRSLPVDELQRALLRQHCRLVFFWDVPLTNPYFETIQWFSLRAHLDGGDRHEFHPDEPLTRASLAHWVYRAMRMTPSVSNEHFSDVPWSYPDFQEIETLYDAHLLSAFGVKPLWPKYGGYSQAKYGGFSQASGFTKLNPDASVTWLELVQTLRAIEGPSTGDPPDQRAWFKNILLDSGYTRRMHLDPSNWNTPVTRAEASAVFTAFLTPNSSNDRLGE